MGLTDGLEWAPLDRIIDNQVARLRNYLEIDPTRPQIIKTVRGVRCSLALEVKGGFEVVRTNKRALWMGELVLIAAFWTCPAFVPPHVLV